MAQTRKPGNNGPWRPLEACSVQQRPAALWSWLEDAGSLTERLRAAVGDVFHVRVLHEGHASLDAEDARLLHAPAGTSARNRQVYLCADAPWVYARTLALTESGHWLDKLGTHPLGERVFAVADTQRSPIQVAKLYPEHELYQAAV
ncbi:MAG TPA: chorismate lyase, partial [Gammaproteobacteria bacterium]|nr:chorismate lyase [Gammaproteobacteria bacterium]